MKTFGAFAGSSLVTLFFALTIDKSLWWTATIYDLWWLKFMIVAKLTIIFVSFFYVLRRPIV